jgi:septal ring factor EnvC (AmiA/AmiB activator)
MPIFHGLLCTVEELKKLSELTEQVAQPLPSNTKDFARFFEERQQAREQLKTLLSSLKPPTLEDLAAEVEQLQTKLAQIEAKLAEEGRAKRERREPVKRDGQRKL